MRKKFTGKSLASISTWTVQVPWARLCSPVGATLWRSGQTHRKSLQPYPPLQPVLPLDICERQRQLFTVRVRLSPRVFEGCSAKDMLVRPSNDGVDTAVEALRCMFGCLEVANFEIEQRIPRENPRRPRDGWLPTQSPLVYCMHRL